jgi:hypothetical protein
MASWNDIRLWQERPRQFLKEATGDQLAREARREAGKTEENLLARLWCEASNWLRRGTTPWSCTPGECYG